MKIKAFIFYVAIEKIQKKKSLVLRFRKGEPLASQSVCMNNHRAIHYR
jgi:hypothetical protein